MRMLTMKRMGMYDHHPIDDVYVCIYSYNTIIHSKESQQKCRPYYNMFPYPFKHQYLF